MGVIGTGLKLHVIGSSSAGNAYLLESPSGDALLLDCGCKWKEIQQAIWDHNVKVTECLLTHEHGDHAAAVKQVLNAGITVYASAGTCRALKIAGCMDVEIIRHDSFIVMPPFSATAFRAEHDVAEPMGFCIRERQTKQTLVYLTDSYSIRYRFPGVNHYLIECNYVRDILDANSEAGIIHPNLRERVLTSHMGLDTCIDYLHKCDRSALQNIILCHLSDTNSHEQRMTEALTMFGKPVTIARNGQTIDLSSVPF